MAEISNLLHCYCLYFSTQSAVIYVLDTFALNNQRQLSHIFEALRLLDLLTGYFKVSHRRRLLLVGSRRTLPP